MKSPPFSIAVLIVAAQVACDPVNLDLRGDEAELPIAPPAMVVTTCERAGHECVPPERLSPGSELCPDSSTPFREKECSIYDSAFAKALCCPKVELSLCEQKGNRCLDKLFMYCPFGFESRADSCDADGRPADKMCCAPIPCEMSMGFCVYGDQMPGACGPEYIEAPLRCSEMLPQPSTCCLPR